jgi:(p)ppGpp synthase/HD superfamily hydrolase
MIENWGLIDKAIRVACLAHQGQIRKGSDVPYISHLFAVALMLQNAKASPEQVAAGILHDTLEDTLYTYEELLNDFGQTVTDYVKFCSEHDPKASWQLRKQHTLDSLINAPDEVRLIVCADKLHNLLSIKEDLISKGETVWERFGKGRDSQAWYYKELARILCSDEARMQQSDLFHEFKTEVHIVFGN